MEINSTVQCLRLTHFSDGRKPTVNFYQVPLIEEPVTLRSNSNAASHRQRPRSFLSLGELKHKAKSSTSFRIDTLDANTPMQSPTSDVERPTRAHVDVTDGKKPATKHSRTSTTLQHLFRHKGKLSDHLTTSSNALNTERDEGRGTLFGLSLDRICKPEGTLPCSILTLLACIWHRGPQTEGVFRRSASARKCREIKAILDSSQSTRASSPLVIDIPIHVATHLFKELLRSMPNCLLGCELYSHWILILQSKHKLNIPQIKRLIGQLTANQRVLLCHTIRVLQRISRQSDVNKMTSSNLGVCIGPSLLWAAPADPSGGTMRKPGVRLLNSVISNSKHLTPTSDYNEDVKDANFPPLIVQHLVDFADDIFNDFNWSSTLYDDIISLQPITSQYSKSMSSLDDSDALYEEPDWPVEGQRPLHVISDSTISTPSDDVIVVAPVPPPRLKKMRRKADEMAMGSATSLTSHLALSALLGNEKGIGSEESAVGTDGCMTTSTDSLFESLDENERNLGDDEISDDDCDLRHKSTQSLTSDLTASSCATCRRSSDHVTDGFRCSSAPVGECFEHHIKIDVQSNALKRRQFQQLSTDSAISADSDVDHVPVLHDVIVVTNDVTDDVRNKTPTFLAESSNITAIQVPLTSLNDVIQVVPNEEILPVNNPSDAVALVESSDVVLRRGMTSSGADLFPRRMRSSAVVVTCPDDVIVSGETRDENDTTSSTMADCPRGDAELPPSTRPTDQLAEIARRRTSLIRLHDKFAHEMRHLASHLCASDDDTSTTTASSSHDNDDVIVVINRSRRRMNQRRESYRTRRERKQKKVERTQSESAVRKEVKQLSRADFINEDATSTKKERDVNKCDVMIADDRLPCAARSVIDVEAMVTGSSSADVELQSNDERKPVSDVGSMTTMTDKSAANVADKFRANDSALLRSIDDELVAGSLPEQVLPVESFEQVPPPAEINAGRYTVRRHSHVWVGLTRSKTAISSREPPARTDRRSLGGATSVADLVEAIENEKQPSGGPRTVRSGSVNLRSSAPRDDSSTPIQSALRRINIASSASSSETRPKSTVGRSVFYDVDRPTEDGVSGGQAKTAEAAGMQRPPSDVILNENREMKREAGRDTKAYTWSVATLRNLFDHSKPAKNTRKLSGLETL